MKTICRKMLLLPILCVSLYATPASAGVNCDDVPYTRLELAICGEPVLRALDSELTAALKDAMSRGIINREGVAEKRNLIARQCRREASDTFNSCILDSELTTLEWVASKLGASSLITGFRGFENWRYDASLAARISQLHRQLTVAEIRLQSTSEPELTLVTILKLISVYKEYPAHTGKIAAKIDLLQRRLGTGCNHLGYGVRWQAILSDNQLSCADLQQPEKLSSFDF